MKRKEETIYKKITLPPVRAGTIPRKIRGGFSSDTIVKITLEALTDENGLTQKDRDDLDEALREFDEEGDTLPIFESMEAFIVHLREIENG